MIESPHARHRHNVAAMIVVLIGVVVSLAGLVAVGLSVSPLSLNAGVQYEGEPLGTWGAANGKKDLFKTDDIQKAVDDGKLYVQIKS